MINRIVLKTRLNLLKDLIEEYDYWMELLQEQLKVSNEPRKDAIVWKIRSEINRVSTFYYLVKVNRSPVEDTINKYLQERDR